MKKFFSFFGRVVAFLSFIGVVLYCTGYFFASKTKKIGELFSKNKTDSGGEE